MGNSNWPLVLIEGVLVFGGALAFGWWQLRSVRRDQERAAAERHAEAAEAAEQAANPAVEQAAAPAAPGDDAPPQSEVTGAPAVPPR